MAEDNPTNPNSGEKNPNHDPFDMLKGDTPAGNTPPPEKKEEETTSTTSGDPFDMVDTHTTPTPTVNTGSSDPFDMVEKPTTPITNTPTGTTSQPDLPKSSEDPLSMVGQPNNPTSTTSQPDLPKSSEDPLSMVGQPNNPTSTTSQPDLPKSSEDPLSMVGQPNNPTSTTSQPDLPKSSEDPLATGYVPPTPSIPRQQPIPNTTIPPPTTSTHSGGNSILEREAYKSNLDLNAVLAAADKVNRMPKLQNTSLEKLDEALFTKRSNTKVSPEEQEEVERKLQYLVNKIKKDLDFYDKKEKKSGKWTLIFSVLSSLLAASVTVLLGLNITDFMRKHNFDWYINTIALVISAFISVIGVLQNFTDSKPLWVKYTDTTNKYQQLLDNIEYMQLASNYITLDDVNQIKLAYNRIKDGTNNYIIQVRSQDDGTGSSSMIRT